MVGFVEERGDSNGRDQPHTLSFAGDHEEEDEVEKDELYIKEKVTRIDKLKSERSKVFTRLMEVRYDLNRVQLEQDEQMAKITKKHHNDSSSENGLGSSLDSSQGGSFTSYGDEVRRSIDRLFGLTAVHETNCCESLKLKRPVLRYYNHEETFYELFYDLVLAVAFIKLSYLKYNMSLSGMATGFAIFANFWSCYSLFVVYVAMFHINDVTHRIYYIAHIATSIGMVISIGNSQFNFFNFKYMVSNSLFLFTLFNFLPL